MKEHVAAYHAREIHCLTRYQDLQPAHAAVFCFLVLSIFVTRKIPQELGVEVIYNCLKDTLRGTSSLLK